MPEYRRFVAYFYEYIDGKKQKNAGFAKVELRNGMWRILFRLTVPVLPEPPVQVYGFVREEGYLLGFPLGTMRIGQEIAEEWACRADVPIGQGTKAFYLDQIAGMRIQSGDGRYFITMWDDGPMDPARFVLKLPGEETKTESGKSAGSEAQGEDTGTAKSEKPEHAQETKSEKSEHTQETKSGKSEHTQETESGKSEHTQETKSGKSESIQETKAGQLNQGAENEEKSLAEIDVEQNYGSEKETGRGSGGVIAVACMQSPEEDGNTGVPEYPNDDRDRKRVRRDQAVCRGKNLMEELLLGRQRFFPFQDGEIRDCVQIMPCDVLRLQQNNWQVGRSSFLQHGYYQYRHLLLGRSKDGRYLLGVPGIRNAHEQYMAHMFGYDDFKMSKICDCGKAFGYWFRILNAPENEPHC